MISWLWLSVPTFAFAVLFCVKALLDASTTPQRAIYFETANNSIVVVGLICIITFIGIIVHNVLVGERIKNIKK